MRNPKSRLLSLIVLWAFYQCLVLAQVTPPQLRYRYFANVAPAGQSSLAIDSIEDITGDGIRDLVVGAPDMTSIYLMTGRTGAVVDSLTLPLVPGFGFDVASTGDANGDGVEDIIVGAPWAGSDGLVYLISGSSFTVISSWGPSAASPGEPAQYGKCVSRAADYTGDGIEEVLVGAPFFSSSAGMIRQGRAEVVDVTILGAVSAINGSTSYRDYGDSVDQLGDITGNGVSEFMVGSSRQAAGQMIPGNAAGQLFVYTFVGGFPSVLANINGIAIADSFGWASGNVGDMDGDGINDLIIGAPDPAQLSVPRSFTVNGAAAAAAGGGQPAWSGIQTSPGPTCLHFGWSVSGIGDLDSDGNDDFLVGAPSIYGSCGSMGRSYVYSGGTGALISTLNVDGSSAGFGYDVSELGVSGNLTLFAVADPTSGNVYVY